VLIRANRTLRVPNGAGTCRGDWLSNGLYVNDSSAPNSLLWRREPIALFSRVAGLELRPNRTNKNYVFGS